MLSGTSISTKTKRTMADIRFITFDLDNTLWDVGQVIGHAEARMNAWLDERVPAYRQAIDRDTLLEIRSSVVHDRPDLGHDVSALRREVLFRGMQRHGLDEATARDNADRAFQVFLAARQEVVFFEHALETLAHLADRYVLAALTNGNADVDRIGLDRYFGFALSSADVSASKPAPDIFHAALERAGVAPQEAIHVGDHLVDDIHGAGSVGMHTIWLKQADKHPAPDQSTPSEVIEHLRELPDAVDRIHDR